MRLPFPWEVTPMKHMYDSTQPWLIPADAECVALYVNGLYAATEAEARRFHGRVLWIDVLGSDAAKASCLDIETGDATPDHVPDWVRARLDAVPGSKCRLYCNRSTWPAVKAKVAGMDAAHRASVRYWIADPTGHEHLVPGSAATQYAWEADYDVSAFSPQWVTLG